jgi:hypothetical protein
MSDIEQDVIYLLPDLGMGELAALLRCSPMT